MTSEFQTLDNIGSALVLLTRRCDIHSYGMEEPNLLQSASSNRPGRGDRAF